MPYNVVFIITDQQRRDAVGCYGNPLLDTPNTDSIAARGVRFTAAYCDSPLCAPSRASLLTGRHACNHKALTHRVNGRDPGVPGNPGIVSSETLGTMFRKGGYATAAIGKVHVHGETREQDLGFDVRKHRFYTYGYADYLAAVGQERVDAYLAGKGNSDRAKYNTANAPVALEERYMQDTLTTDSSIEFIRANADRPFFIHVGLEKPHPAWWTQAKYHSLYDPADFTPPATRRQWVENPAAFSFISDGGVRSGRAGWTDDEARHCMAAYYACISEVDANVGRILATLDECGLRDNTVVIFTSDHGENLFDHGLMQKHCFYEASVAVPLIVSVPGGPGAGEACDRPCSLIDLMPTLADLCGLPTPADADGVSLVEAMAGGGDPDRPIFSEFHDGGFTSRMIRTPRWKYIYYPGRCECLFDVVNDPGEMNDLAGDPARRALCDELRARLLEGWNVPGVKETV